MKISQKMILKTVALSLILSTSMFLQSCKQKEEATEATEETAVVEEPVVTTDATIDSNKTEEVVTKTESGEKPLTNPNEKKP